MAAVSASSFADTNGSPALILMKGLNSSIGIA